MRKHPKAMVIVNDGDTPQFDIKMPFAVKWQIQHIGQHPVNGAAMSNDQNCFILIQFS